MLYTIPKYNAVDFDFVVGDYEVRSHNEVNFVFGAFGTQRLLVNQQWDVEVSQPVMFDCTSQWGVEIRTFYAVAYPEYWETAGVLDFAGKLNQQWGSEVSVGDLSFKLGQEWVSLSPDSQDFVLTQEYATLVKEDETFHLNQRHSSSGLLGNENHQIGQLWGSFQLSELILFGAQQWATLGIDSEFVLLDQEWDTLPLFTENLFIDQEWVTIVPGTEKHMLNQQWAFEYQVATGLVILYPNTIGSESIISYALGTTQVREEFIIRSDLVGNVGVEFVVDSNISNVRTSLDIVYHMTLNASIELVLVSDMVQRVSSEIVIQQDIVGFDRAFKATTIVYSLLGASAVLVETAPVVAINGTTVTVEDAEVSIEEGQFAWTCQITLNDAAHYALFTNGDSFTLTIGGEVYSFLVDSKSLSRGIDDNGAPQIRASIAGISPSVLFSDPYAEKVTKTWDTATLAIDVVNEVLLGESIDWRILNWSIPAFRLGVESQSPIDIIKLIVSAPGALLETEPDGSMYVRYTYPKSIQEYAFLTPDQEYSDIDHNFSLDENSQSKKIFNKLRVLDIADDAKKDRVEFVQDELNTSIGKLKVFTSPWRQTVTVESTSLPIVSSVFVGVETEDLEETVEVLDGKGSVSHPIYQVDALEWLYVDLTGVVFEVDSSEFTTTHATNKESLLKISYKTRYLRFNASAFPNAEVQFLVKDVV